MPYQRELDLALDIARRAGDVAMYYYDRRTDTEEKEDRSPVTIADRESERLISRLLSQSFPRDGILGEEGAFKESRSGRRWLIDPIDGTRDFVRRLPFWAIQIALQDQGLMVLGIIYIPCQSEMIHAVLGSGCFLNDVQARASGLSRLDGAVLTISGFRDAWKAWGAEPIHYLTSNCWTVRAFSGCYDVTLIARGKVDIWLSGGGMEWDYAPGVVVARECGARFLTKEGSDRIDAGHAVICTPEIEQEVRRILEIPAAPRR